MVTFFTIFLILVVVNLALIIFSAVDAGQKVSQFTKMISDASTADIYPFDLIPSKYKKVI